jgi:hypothetical protein
VSPCAQRNQSVLVDVTAGPAGELPGLADEHLCLTGLHHELGVAGCDEVVDAMIARMALLQATHGVILTRISLGASDDPGDPFDMAVAIDEALDDACASFRFPRPARLVMTY